MTIIESYYYLFYKLNKFSKWTPSIFQSDFNAVVLLNGLEIAFVATICFFIEVYNEKHTPDGVFLVELVLPSIFIVLFNALIFSKQNKNLASNMKTFDTWPAQKKTKGTILILSIILLIIFLCIVSGNLSGKYNSLNNH